MSAASDVWNELASSVNGYEEGDVLTVASWIGLLEQAEPDTPESGRAAVRDLVLKLREALRSGELAGVATLVGTQLDGLSAPAAPAAPANVPDGLWEQHGPAFVSETYTRLARAEELTLLLEERSDPELLGELFRVFHTIKGEAGFLRRVDLSTMAHRTEERLEAVRSGQAVWDSATADQVLRGIDGLKNALSGGARKSGPRGHDILRVPASKIDALIAQIGELLVAQESEPGSQSPAVRKLGRALQQSALRLRTEPLTELMNRLKRGARDLAHQLNKPVEVALAGLELELDRTLIATLEEPLMHLIRNALDHGLEAEDVRAAKGKPVEGRLVIEAQRRGNRIVIAVGDDGKGLDAVRIWAKGVEKGLVSGGMPEDRRSVYELIFRPGFSTADTLSEVSGRGVGMDIVASSVKAARGLLNVSTQAGKGTRVEMTFPLSTAVLDALVVALDDRKFLVPVHSVLESLPVNPAAITPLAGGGRVFSLRGEPLPVFSLRHVLDRHGGGAPRWGVVTQTSRGERQILLVDQVEAKKEVVIRSLGRLFRRLQAVSAAAVLAGGTPALVLDIDQIVKLARAAS
jgi:two-component system chemotaxis sensor kinase CheA